MNIYIIVVFFLAFPAINAQNNSICQLICRLLQQCGPVQPASYCTTTNINAYATRCRCRFNPATTKTTATTTRTTTTTTKTTTTATTTTTRRPPVVSNGCGIGGMPNRPFKFLDSLPRIVGGYPSPEDYFPWQVKLRPGRAHCGGALINGDTIVTAAHCVIKYTNNPESVEVLYGSVDVNRAESVRASAVFVHPEYSQQSVPDIAIIKLPRSLRFTKAVRPVCLPRQNQAVVNGSMSIVSGWGVLTESNRRISPIMQYVAVPIVDQDQCNRFFRSGIRDSEFCAGYSEGGHDACQGDSGGGLVMPNAAGTRWELIGVVSRGIGCARRNLPGIYARVPNYVAWIRGFM